MTEKTDRKQSMVVQAGIFAIAGIVVRIIGLLYNTPLVKIIGDEGFGYYDSAYAAYSIVLLISSYSIPSAVSKIIAQHLAKKEYRTAYRIFKCTLGYVMAVGLIASLFVFFGASILVKMENAVLPLRILAPTIFFSGVLGAFRGFFQARHSMVPTSVSQIIEQVFNAIFSVWMAYVLVGIAAGRGASIIASYGAAGSTIGTGVGVLSGLCFMILVYIINRPSFLQKVEADSSPEVMSYGQIIKLIFLVVTPFILTTAIYNVNIFMDKTIYQIVLMKVKKVTEASVAFDLSAYSKANKIANIPIAIASAMASTLIPRLSSHMALGEINSAKAQVKKAVKVTMFISIPSAVGLAVLAKPIIMLLFPQPASVDMASSMLMILSLSVVLYGLSTLTQAVLQSIGHMNVPIINAAVAVVLHALVMVGFMMMLPEKYMIYVYGWTTIVYALILCILNGIAVTKYLGYRQEIGKTFVRPGISAAIMGVMAYLVYYLSYKFINSNFISIILSVIVAVVVYFVLCIKWKSISEEELSFLPKGRMIVKICKKLRLL